MVGNVEVLLLELELVLEDFRQVRPKEALLTHYTLLLERLVDIMAMTLRGTISKGSQATLEQISNGDTI